MNQDLKRYLNMEENVQMIGWDFSKIDPFLEETKLPWDYLTLVKQHLKPSMSLLDMETGAGEVLETFGHDPLKTTVTEGYAPNLLLCNERLRPKGFTVVNALGEETLPFKDNQFDIITNRHGAYRIEEIKRVLRPGGLFITQQVGSKNNQTLAKRLLLPYSKDRNRFTLETESKKFLAAGFSILDKKEALQTVKYLDIFAVIFMAKIIDWEFPNFSVTRCFNALRDIEKEIKEKGYITSEEHRFFLLLKSKKDS